MKLIAQVCMFNEMEKGNLERCLENLRLYCDEIVVYDDASTDNSVEIASEYTSHIIRGEKNNQNNELEHKAAMLEKAKELGATHCFWLDCDEVLDRAGTMGGLRTLCESWPEGLDAYSFPELNLWRSQTYVRTDSLFTKARFVRLWKIDQNTAFSVREGVHLRLYPSTIETVQEAPFGVIHYGFWDYKKMLVKIGAHDFDAEQLHANAATNWILNETECDCYKLSPDRYPPGCFPPDVWKRPAPKQILALPVYGDVPEEKSLPIIDPRCRDEWKTKHKDDYHGNYDSIIQRNKFSLKHKDNLNRLSLFRFDPKKKTIIDLGCGGGWFALDCINNGAKKVYGLEVDPIILANAQKSFEALGIDPKAYHFADIEDASTPQVDLVFCVAVMMHLPYWQYKVYLNWISEHLKAGGEAHIQLYDKGDGNMLFLNNIDNVSRMQAERDMKSAGFTIEDSFIAEGPGVIPVWRMYELRKNE